jgi:hypothetical protein
VWEGIRRTNQREPLFDPLSVRRSLPPFIEKMKQRQAPLSWFLLEFGELLNRALDRCVIFWENQAPAEGLASDSWGFARSAVVVSSRNEGLQHWRNGSRMRRSSALVCDVADRKSRCTWRHDRWAVGTADLNQQRRRRSGGKLECQMVFGMTF